MPRFLLRYIFTPCRYAAADFRRFSPPRCAVDTLPLIVALCRCYASLSPVLIRCRLRLIFFCCDAMLRCYYFAFIYFLRRSSARERTSFSRATEPRCRCRLSRSDACARSFPRLRAALICEAATRAVQNICVHIYIYAKRSARLCASVIDALSVDGASAIITMFIDIHMLRR